MLGQCFEVLTCIYAGNCSDNLLIFFIIIFSEKPKTKHRGKCVKKLDPPFQVFHSSFQHIFQTFCLTFITDNFDEKVFTFFTPIFTCKYVWNFGVELAKKDIKNISNFPSWFPLTKVMKIIVTLLRYLFQISHLDSQAENGEKDFKIFTPFFSEKTSEKELKILMIFSWESHKVSFQFFTFILGEKDGEKSFKIFTNFLG